MAWRHRSVAAPCAGTWRNAAGASERLPPPDKIVASVTSIGSRAIATFANPVRTSASGPTAFGRFIGTGRQNGAQEKGPRGVATTRTTPLGMLDSAEGPLARGPNQRAASDVVRPADSPPGNAGRHTLGEPHTLRSQPTGLRCVLRHCPPIRRGTGGEPHGPDRSALDGSSKRCPNQYETACLVSPTPTDGLPNLSRFDAANRRRPLG